MHSQPTLLAPNVCEERNQLRTTRKIYYWGEKKGRRLMRSRSKQFVSVNFISAYICVTLVCLAIPLAYGSTQLMPDGPITKENLLSALKYGKEHENKRMSASWWVER